VGKGGRGLTDGVEFVWKSLQGLRTPTTNFVSLAAIRARERRGMAEGVEGFL
jgi:hypothetical protein